LRRIAPIVAALEAIPYAVEQPMSWLRRHRIALTLGWILATIALLSSVPMLIPYLLWIVVGTCVLSCVAAFLSGDRFDAGLAFCIAISFLCAKLLFLDLDPVVLVVRTSAILSYLLLHAVLLIGPWSRLVPRFISLYKRRRHLGVAVFLLALLHSNLVLSVFFSWDFSLAWSIVFPFFGAIALFILFVLALTSWDWWQKYVTWRIWSLIHAFVLVGYLAGLFWAQTIWSANGGAPAWTAIASGSFLFFWVLVAPWGVAPHVMRVVNGWKQLHLLVHIAFASLVLHVWFGAALMIPIWGRALVLLLAGLVWGSHLAGWILKWARSRRVVRTPDCSAEPWHDVCALIDLSDAGKRVEVHGVPLALFLHQGKPLAFFGYCSHQKGPLWLGKIENGYLTCPWHGWQFSIADGSAPPGFHDRIPFFETKIVEERVWVKISKQSSCVDYSCKGCKCRT
jgi:nitrite reductase/ring-hydroxylating ferredoxin subunit/DMSO/TMAO reductase YedYZ heme-binding membrane subunit